MTDQTSSRSSGGATADTVGGDSLLERLPESILNEVFLKIDSPLEKLTTVCSVACVSRALHLSANKVLSSFSSIDLSTISLDSQMFDGIVRRVGKIRKISLDCLRMNDSSIQSFIGPDVEELVLLKCKSVSYELLASIGTTCPNLRVLTLEFSGYEGESALYNFIQKSFLGNCPYLESLNIKFSDSLFDWLFALRAVTLSSLQTSDSATQQFRLLLQTVKVLKLEPVNASDTLVLLSTLASTNMGVPVPTTFGQTLTHITLVLDNITNVLVSTIADCLPLLVELDLKDEPKIEPRSNDLSDSGVTSLVRRCRHLTSISFVRSKRHVATSFKRITNEGMVLLLEGCEGLESLRICGFSKVNDVGFASILNRCLNLKKLEIQNAFHLTDSSFKNVRKFPRSLEEVKLVACRSITSKAVNELVACCSLEVLDLRDCQMVSDSCLGDISCLASLTSLNLECADLTDAGMAILGKAYAPISRLSLSGCKRVTEKGITFLLESEGSISKTLSSLDLSYMRGITDKAIITVVNACVGLTELCIRNCFYVTDVSVMALAIKGKLNGESKLLRKLDLYECKALSAASFEFLKKPFFHGLQWIGIGRTDLYCADDGLAEIYRERRLLFICVGGCKMGCHDKWPSHKTVKCRKCGNLGHNSWGCRRQGGTAHQEGQVSQPAPSQTTQASSDPAPTQSTQPSTQPPVTQSTQGSSSQATHSIRN